jgi:CheY-like chemotaxis protein
LNFIELDQPRVVDRVFLVTAMPEQTVVRMAPQFLPRYYRKPFDQAKLITEIVSFLRPPPSAETPEAGPRVLVVDDDEVSSALTAALTEGIGYAVETAANGRDAIAKLTEKHFDAVVLDLMMPQIDGFSVLEFLQRRRPEMLGCTIILSGLPERYRQGLAQYDLPAILEKPVDASRLREVLEQCVADRG